MTANRPTRILMYTQVRMKDALFDKILDYSRGFATRIRNSDVKEVFYGNNVIRVEGIYRHGNPTSAIGQSADYIYVDEADFITNDAMENTILPISSTSINCRVCMISTMSGISNTYFKRWMTDRNLTNVYSNTFNHVNTEHSVYVENDELEWEYLGYSYLKENVSIRWQGKTHET